MNAIVEVLVDMLVSIGLRRSTAEEIKHNKMLSLALLALCIGAVAAMGTVAVYQVFKIVKPP